MSFKLGLAGLCTSHPMTWNPIIKTVSEELKLDVEIVAAWDSGETRPEGFARDFCRQYGIANAPKCLEDMVEMVDGVIVHTANWDKHVEQARIFVKNGKSVLLDKPVVGNMTDAQTVLDWVRSGKRVTGGSSLRFAPNLCRYARQSEHKRGRIHTAYCCVGTDEFNYGIHGYAALTGLLGGGIESVRYIATCVQDTFMLRWNNGAIGMLTCGRNVWLPCLVTAVSDRAAKVIKPVNFYKGFLRKVLPYLCGRSDVAPLEADELLVPEFAVMAAKISKDNGGTAVFLKDIPDAYKAYDGTLFAAEYKAQRA